MRTDSVAFQGRKEQKQGKWSLGSLGGADSEGSWHDVQGAVIGGAVCFACGFPKPSTLDYFGLYSTQARHLACMKQLTSSERKSY